MSVMSGCGCTNVTGSDGGCGSGPATRGSSVSSTGLLRPTFFPGQLLTEDDLEALAQYVTAKDRLHNRFLVGSGVVCGLEVRCHPNDRGKVLVTSGYAIDCCGADIIVACDTEVDVVSEISALPRDHSCLDPCPPEQAKAAVGNGTLEKASPGSMGNEAESTLRLRRRYVLAIEYQEQLTQPALTYAVAGDAGPSCEPTRVREGHRFVIRCVHQAGPSTTVISQLEACLGPIQDNRKEQTRTLRDRVQDALDLANNVPCLLRSEEVTEGPQRAYFAARAVESRRKKSLKDPVALRDEVSQVAAGLFAKTTFKDSREQLATLLRTSETMLTDEAVVGLEGTRFRAMKETLEQISDRVAGATGPVELPDSARLLALGVPAGAVAQAEYATALRDLRDWLVGRFEERGSSECSLPCEVARLRIDEESPETMATAAAVILRAVARLLVDCLCAAVNPPCPTCCDVAIPLAEVTVDGCDVVDICGCVRDHVVTSANVGYWLPFVGRINDALRALCHREPTHWSVKGDCTTVQEHPLLEQVEAIECLVASAGSHRAAIQDSSKPGLLALLGALDPGGAHG